MSWSFDKKTGLFEEVEGDIDENLSVKSFILVLRSFTQKHNSFFTNNKERFLQKLTEQEPWKEREEILCSKSDEYLNLLGLLSHKYDTDLVHNVWNIVLSLFFLRCLSLISWSPAFPSESEELAEDEVYLCLLIIHVWQLAQYNTHTMAELITSHSAVVRTQEVGLAIRPASALLNHSCWPNTVRCSRGYKVVIMASTNIMVGEEVTDTYTQTFHQVTKEVRQEKCRSYKFVCTCLACKDDWPLLQDLPSSLIKASQGMFINHLPRHQVIKLGEDLIEADRQARQLFDTGETWQALARWREMCELAREEIKQPSRIFIIVRERIQACLWRLYGQQQSSVHQG